MKPKPHSKNQNQKNNSLTNILWIGAALGAGTLIVTAGISMARLQDENRRVNQIARHFPCICEMKCNLTVAACSCTKPGGASERKAFIRDAFKQGLKEPEVMMLYKEKYGGLISETIAKG